MFPYDVRVKKKIDTNILRRNYYVYKTKTSTIEGKTE